MNRVVPTSTRPPGRGSPRGGRHSAVHCQVKGTPGTPMILEGLGVPMILVDLGPRFRARSPYDSRGLGVVYIYILMEEQGGKVWW